MVIKKIVVKKFNFIPSGSIDFKAIQDTFDDLGAQLNQSIDDINAQEARRGIFTRFILVEGQEPVELLEEGRYRDVKMLSGFISAADNIKDLSNQIKLVDRKGHDLVTPETIKAGEKSGKAHSLTIHPFKGTGKLDSVRVIPSSVRKAIVCVTFQEI